MKEDVLAKLREVKSAEELLAIARENGGEATAEEAQKVFDMLHATGELSADDLAAVAGGSSGSQYEYIHRFIFGR